MADGSVAVVARQEALKVMQTMLQKIIRQAAVVGALALLLGGCASQAPTPQANAAAEGSRTALACTLTTQCVNSLDGGDPGPLRYQGSPTQALSVLRATLAEFPEAKIVKTDGPWVKVVFTTSLGFRDLVDFRIDAQAQRIDYRSRSSFGLFDFGKNRSRMLEFSSRFEQNARR
jgi:uncharacterized protein (DUF1499 family)